MGLNAILSGHTNELLGLNINISQARLKVCKQCPLYKRSIILGEICNSKLWYNIETGDISTIEKDGYVRGCGCRLRAKTTVPNEKCPLNKW